MSKIINYYDCALSNQYSKDSKIFFFPMKAVPNQWLEKREFWINGTNKQLLYFIVTKISNNKQTPTIAPILTNSQNTFYKLTSKSHIMERELYEPKKFLKNLKNVSYF